MYEVHGRGDIARIKFQTTACVRVSCGCYNKCSQTGWLYTIEVSSVRVRKPCTSDWDLNPRGGDSNWAKTHSLPTEITHLVSGLNEAQVLDVSSQKEFSERQSDR